MRTQHGVSARVRPVPDYRPFMGRHYDMPNACFVLVEQVYRECYGIDLAPLNQLCPTATQRVHYLFDGLTQYAYPITYPHEGDLALIQSTPWHIGLVIGPAQLMHVYHGGTPAVVDYTSVNWVRRIKQFYRYAA